MSFLRVFGLTAIGPLLCGQVIPSKLLPNRIAAGGNCFRRHADAISPHIGDQTCCFAIDIKPFIQFLRQPHGALRTIAKFSGSLLLQGRGGERGCGIAQGRLCFDTANGKVSGFQCTFGNLGGFLVDDGKPVQLLAVKVGQTSDQGGIVSSPEINLDGPVFAWLECLYLNLPLTDQAKRHGLHPSCRLSPRQLAPKHRRQGKADEIIQRSSGLLGINQIHIQITGVIDTVQNGAFSNFIKDHPLRMDVMKAVVVFQRLHDMPGNGLPFPIRVGGEIKMIATPNGLGNCLHPLGGLVVGDIGHGEIFIGQDRAILGWQIAHMTVAGQHNIVVPKIFVDGFGLGRRFDDDNVHNLQTHFIENTKRSRNGIDKF